MSQTPGTPQNAPQQNAPSPAVQQAIPQSAPTVSGPPTPIQASAVRGAKVDVERVGTPQSAQDSSEQSASTEPVPKKRKRGVKTDPEPLGAGILETQNGGILSRKTGEDEKLPLPSSNDDDLAFLDAFKRKRTAGATVKFPQIPGAPRLAMAGTVKLPGESKLSAVTAADVRDYANAQDSPEKL